MSEKMFSSFDIMKVLSEINSEEKEIIRATNSELKDNQRTVNNDLIIDFTDIFNGNFSECNTVASLTARLINDAYNRGRKEVLLDIMTSLSTTKEKQENEMSWLEKR